MKQTLYLISSLATLSAAAACTTPFSCLIGVSNDLKSFLVVAGAAIQQAKNLSIDIPPLKQTNTATPPGLFSIPSPPSAALPPSPVFPPPAVLKSPPPIANSPPALPPSTAPPPPALSPPPGVFLNGTWIVDYGREYLTANGSAITFEFPLNSSWPYDTANSFLPGGARIRTPWTSRNANFCIDAKTADGDNPGAIFAIYATSGEPVDRSTEQWDELDMEFLGRSPDKMWINYYHNGPIPGWYGENKAMGITANTAFNTYCLDWDNIERNTAIWTINGADFYSIQIDSWVKPMYVAISYWAYNHPWAGRIEKDESIYSTIMNFNYTIRD